MVKAELDLSHPSTSISFLLLFPFLPDTFVLI